MKYINYILIYIITIIIVLSAIYMPEQLPRGIFGGALALGAALATKKYRKQNNNFIINKKLIIFNILLLIIAFMIGIIAGFKTTIFIVCFLSVCLIGIGSIVINCIKHK